MPRDTFLNGPGAQYLQKVWSDEARAAALEARRSHGRTPHDENPTKNPYTGSPGDTSTQAGAETHMAATNVGWEHEGPSGSVSGSQVYGHSQHPGTKLNIWPNGRWSHYGQINGVTTTLATGEDDKSLAAYTRGEKGNYKKPAADAGLAA